MEYVLKYHLNQFGAGWLAEHIVVVSLSVRYRKYLRWKLRTCNNLSCKGKHNLDSALRFGKLRPLILMQSFMQC